MSSYSPKLEYFCQRLEGLSVGQFRLEPQNQTSNIQPQSIIRFTLPSNALCDIRSFAWHFNAQTSAGSNACCLRLPNMMESLLNRVEVTIGGVAVSSGCNFYNVLCHAKQVVDRSRNDAGQNHPEIITTGGANGYVDGTSLVANEQPSSLNNEAQFCVSQWEGFLGECEPAVLDTSLLGDIVISLYLEQASLCITNSSGVTKAAFKAGSAAPTAISYTLNNVYATIRCYSLASGMYDNMISEQLEQAGSLEIGFKQYFSFRDKNTGSTRWTVASQSLDRVLVAHHHNVAPTQLEGHPNHCVGYNEIADDATLASLKTSAADRVLGLGKVKYIHPYSSFSEAAPVAGSLSLYQWQLNGASYPQYRATPEDVYQIMRLASQDDERTVKDGLHQFRVNRFVAALKLTLDAPNARYIQGLDTRSVSLNGYYNIFNGAAAGKDITLFAEVTSSLLISAGRQIEIVQ